MIRPTLQAIEGAIELAATPTGVKVTEAAKSVIGLYDRAFKDLTKIVERECAKERMATDGGCCKATLKLLSKRIVRAIEAAVK